MITVNEWWSLMIAALAERLKADPEITADASLDAIYGNDPRDFAHKLYERMKAPDEAA